MVQTLSAKKVTLFDLSQTFVLGRTIRDKGLGDKGKLQISSWTWLSMSSRINGLV